MAHTWNVVPVTPADYRRLAERRLPRFIFDYLDGGANDELTLARNVSDLQGLALRQRVLRDVSAIDTSTTLAGHRVAMPLALAPVGLAGMMARRAEAQAVRVAEAAGVPFTLSTVGTCPMEEVRAAATQPFWFQLYMVRDRGVVKALLERAAANGCDTLVFTVDLPLTGMRHRDVRNGMLSPGARARLAKLGQLLQRPGWLLDVGIRGKPHRFGNLSDQVPDPDDLQAFRAWVEAQFDPSVTWKDIEWLRAQWPGRLLLKGVLEADDARAAAEVGADGVIVSNHGGRQLDAVASTIAKLPAVAAAVGERIEVLMDGGVRSGVDVMKALASGARGVLVGRPWAWALAGAGPAGLQSLLATFRRELQVAMALGGVSRIADIGPGALDG